MSEHRRRRIRRTTVVALVAALAALAAACSGGDEPAAPDPVTSTTTTPPSSSSVSPSSSTTIVDAPNVDPDCAAPLEDREPLPSGDRVAVAVDLDGDGVADPVYFLADDELGGSWIQVDRSSDGASTAALRLDGVFGAETFLDAADLDGDGRDEGFLELAGNTFLSGVIVEIEGCDLRAVTTDDPAYDYGDGVFTYPVFAGGNGCAPTGCITSTVCTTDSAGGVALEIVNAFPTISALDPDFEPDGSSPITDRTVELSYDAFLVENGYARPAPTQGLHPPTVGTVAADSAEVGAWMQLNGLHSDRLTHDSSGCDVFPELGESDDWKLIDEAFVPGAPVQWAVYGRDDGARIDIASPGVGIATSDELGTVDLPSGPGTIIGSVDDGGPIGPISVRWTTAETDEAPYCAQWSAWTDDVGPVEFSAAIGHILGAGSVAWADTE